MPRYLVRIQVTEEHLIVVEAPDGSNRTILEASRDVPLTSLTQMNAAYQTLLNTNELGERVRVNTAYDRYKGYWMLQVLPPYGYLFKHDQLVNMRDGGAFTTIPGYRLTDYIDHGGVVIYLRQELADAPRQAVIEMFSAPELLRPGGDMQEFWNYQQRLPSGV